MALTLGTLTSDALSAVATYLAQNANSIAAAGDEFIEGLASSKDINFQIGELPSLNWLTLNFETELTEIRDERVASPDLSLATINANIDQIAALVAPTAPDLSVPVAVVPSLDAQAPTITLPTAPTADIGAMPTDAPSVEEVATPAAPVVTLPNVPTFEELQLPVAPSVTLPTFAGTLPQNQLAAPTQVFSYSDTGYSSDLADPLVAKLLDNLTNGGYGIETADEQALWARARDRAEQAARAAVEEAQRRAVSSSFPMPQGAYHQAVAAAQQALQAKMSEVNREIALKRADLYVENRKFTIQEVQKYEQMAREFYQAVQERALNFAKATVELGVALYDAGVRNYAAQLDAYRVEAQVFESRMRAELTKAELFKSQIEAERLRGEFNQQKIGLYQAQLNGIQTVVNLYKSRVEAAGLLSDIQKTKLEVFKTRVMAFGERVRAKAAEYDMYKASIAGELAKLDVFKSQIAAHQSRVEAEEAKGRLTLQANESLLQEYRASVQRYEAQLEGLAKVVSARLERAKTQVAAQSGDVEAYRAFVSALVESARVRVANQSVNNQWNIAALNSQVDQVRFRLETLKATVDNMNNINRFGAEYFRTALGSTLAGLNGLSVKTTEG
ncbi:MAG TPA: hypothetical protein VD931_22715 [Baekduia sp.]|nr:hypothetical protein [Baekduia sp.]